MPKYSNNQKTEDDKKNYSHTPLIVPLSFAYSIYIDSSLYAHYVFKAFDVNCNGAISFRVIISHYNSVYAIFSGHAYL